jgi:flagellar motor switch protein FliM
VSETTETEPEPEPQQPSPQESTAQEQAEQQKHDLLAEEPEEAHVDQRGRERRIRTIDFSQPTKFTADFRRRVGRLLGPFCEAVANRLSTELRAPVELRVSDSSQLTWSAARAQLPAPSVSVALNVRPIERQMLLEIELPLVLQALECLLGGSAAQAPRERRLSEIDWGLTRGLLEAIVSQLALAWRDLGGLELTFGQIDLEGDAGVFVPIGEPTFSLTLECRIDAQPSTMTLLIPWSAIEPVAGELLGAEDSSTHGDPHEQHAVERGLAGAEVQLRAEVGSVQMPIEQMVALTPGSLLTLEDRAEDGVALFAEGVPLGRGRPGLSGARRAVKLTSSATPTASRRLRASLTAGTDGAQSSAGADEGEEKGGRAQETASTLAGMERMVGVPVRVWAELGRTHMPLGHALELPPGTVVELDQGAQAPIELFAGGLPFAQGSLQVSAEGEWAVQVQALV